MWGCELKVHVCGHRLGTMSTQDEREGCVGLGVRCALHTWTRLRFLQYRFLCSSLDCCQGHMQNLHCDMTVGLPPLLCVRNLSRPPSWDKTR